MFYVYVTNWGEVLKGYNVWMQGMLTSSTRALAQGIDDNIPSM